MTENEQNPFLIPPPPKAEPAAPTPDDVETPDAAAPLITLPPGLVDSATHRLGSRVTKRQAADDATPVRRAPDEIVFFPAPPGAPAVPQEAAPSGPPASTETPPSPVRTSWLGDSDATVIRPSGSGASWRLTLPGGKTVELGRTTFIGRNPAPTAGWPDADLLAVSDPAKSVSKTHALLEIVDGRLWVHDLDSTNGVWLVVPGSDDARVPPRERVAVPPGADLELGEFTVQIEHSGR